MKNPALIVQIICQWVFIWLLWGRCDTIQRLAMSQQKLVMQHQELLMDMHSDLITKGDTDTNTVGAIKQILATLESYWTRLEYAEDQRRELEKKLEASGALPNKDDLL